MWRRQRRRPRQRQKNPRSRNWRLFRQLFFGALLIGLIVGIGYGVWYVTRQPAVTITEVYVSKGKTISASDIKVLVEEELAGTYFGLVPKEFTYSYPKNKIITRILNIQKIKDVEVTREKNKLTINFTEYRPHGLWCKSISESSACIFLDEDGYAFEEAPNLRGGAFMRYVIESTDPTIDETPFSEFFIETSQSFASLIQSEKQFVVSHIEVTADMDVIYHLVGGARIITGLSSDAQHSFENLLTVLDSEEFSHITQNNFEYIDLRFGNKVYVQEEKPIVEDVATSTASSTE